MASHSFGSKRRKYEWPKRTFPTATTLPETTSGRLRPGQPLLVFGNPLLERDQRTLVVSGEVAAALLRGKRDVSPLALGAGGEASHLPLHLPPLDPVEHRSAEHRRGQASEPESP